jgi:hypothetical protein
MSRELEASSNLDAIRQAYEEMAGTWTGCDWRTCFGDNELDLNGCTAAKAAARAAQIAKPELADEWCLATQWLSEVERKADEAAVQGALALAAANAGCTCEALEHARRAWVLERETGRPTPRVDAPSWQQLYQAIEQTQRPSRPVGFTYKPEAASSTLERRLADMAQNLERLAKRVAELENAEEEPLVGSHAGRDY